MLYTIESHSRYATRLTTKHIRFFIAVVVDGVVIVVVVGRITRK